MASHIKIPPRTTVDKPLKDKKATENYFCSVLLGETPLRVILYLPEGDPLGQLLLKRCRDANYDCYLMHQESQVMESLGDQPYRHQVVVLVDVRATSGAADQSYNNLEHFSKFFGQNGLNEKVGLIGLIKDFESTKNINQFIQNGISRLLTCEDCMGDRFLWELKMVESSEAVFRERQIFGLALYEAVDQSNDAIQITGKDSNIMYVNRAFLELSGYSIEEVIGQPAWDILRPYDSKPDNGPKGAVRKGQGWDGICMGRRKSGGILRQHLKLIPVRNAADHAYHHVTIQRLLSVHESDIPRLQSPRTVRSPSEMLVKQPSLSKVMPKLESPLTKAVQMLNSARDNPSTPPDVRDILEKAIDSLSASELYTISTSGKSSGGIVSGLLMGGPRFPQTYSRMPQPHPHALPQNPPITPNPPEVQVALKNIEEWDFDIIAMENISKSRPLYYCGMRIFGQFDVCTTLNIDIGVLSSWLKLMEANYHHQNPYHNSTHAADVLQATAYFIKLLQDNLVLQAEVLEQSEVASLLISAAVHDLDHPARTNPYLCNTRHELAILYNDTAVLENHHVAFCFKVTEQRSDVNIFKNLDTAAYRTMRKSIIELVLATDMAKHFEHLTKFNTMFKLGDETSSSTNLLSTTNLTASQGTSQNRMIMKKVLVKCADISNPCRPLPLCQEWAQRIAQEYFAQTDDEKARNLPVVFPDFDRNSCRLPVTQVKFIDYFIFGLFESWNSFCPIPTLMDHLKSNYEHWKSGCPDSPTYSEEEPELPNSS